MENNCPLDWGYGMTTCIASICGQTDSVVAVADFMLSTGDSSTDTAAIKLKAIGNKWATMFATDDASEIPAILDRISTNLSGESYAEIQELCRRSYADELRLRAETLVLGVYNESIESFKRDGLTRFGQEAFGRILYQIEQAKLSTTLLGFGHDLRSRPRVFTVENPGMCYDHSLSGYWAIGSGQNIAIGTLAANNASPVFLPEASLLYLLCCAKFNSERAPGVGRSTLAIIIRADGSRLTLTDEIELIRRVWDSERPKSASSAGFDAAAAAIALKSASNDAMNPTPVPPQ